MVGEFLLAGVARNQGEKMGCAPMRFGAQYAAEALGLLLTAAEGARDLDRHVGVGQVDGEVGDQVTP